MSGKPKVVIVMGSDSDLPVMNEAAEILKSCKVRYAVKIMSAHRSPDDVAAFAKSARRNGVSVIIAGAGGAAHLAGVIASFTTIPVIGVPMDTRELKGVDSLFSVVQMPAGIPVATVTIGKAGAKNAAVLAIQILSLNDKRLGKYLDEFKKKLVLGVREKNKKLCA